MSEDDPSEEDPLERLYTDGDSFDRERLAEALDGVIKIDKDSGDPVFLDGYDDLNGKQQFLAQLLHRRAAEALGELEGNEVGIETEEVMKNLDVSKGVMQNYASDLRSVSNSDEKGGYHLVDSGISKAIEMVSN